MQTVTNELEVFILKQNVNDKFVVFKISGILSSGKTSDINFSKIRQKFLDQNAEYILIHRSQLKSKKLETILVFENKNHLVLVSSSFQWLRV